MDHGPLIANLIHCTKVSRSLLPQLGVFFGFCLDFCRAVCCAQDCAIDGSAGWKLQMLLLFNNIPGLRWLLQLVPANEANLTSLLSADLPEYITQNFYLVINNNTNATPRIYSGQKRQGGSLQINRCF